MQKVSRKAWSGFVPPNQLQRKKALGDFTNECQATIKALSNVDKFWEPMRVPEEGDWLDSSCHDCVGYDQFKGKKITEARQTIYVQPIVYEKNSCINDKNMA